MVVLASYPSNPPPSNAELITKENVFYLDFGFLQTALFFGLISANYLLVL